MTLHYSDQMTGAAANLLSMQCWAFRLGHKVSVVEPFIQVSTLGVDSTHLVDTNSTAGNHVESVKLTDVYEWESFANKHFASLVNWYSFLLNAPRRMVVVD